MIHIDKKQAYREAFELYSEYLKRKSQKEEKDGSHQTGLPN